MARHTFFPKTYYLSYGVYPPAQILQSEDCVQTVLLDAHGYDQNGIRAGGSPNPLTGPFVIEEASPGDVLAVTIDRLYPNRRRGWASQSLHPNLFEYSPGEYHKDYVEWALSLEEGAARPLGVPAPLDQLVLPFTPVLGCIGVAPGVDGEALSIDCGAYGGNMDLCLIAAGVTIYLPVLVKGAYLFVGDGHAAQADGEMTGNGIEVSFDIQFRVNLIQGLCSGWIRAENEDRLIVIANQKPAELAFRSATQGMAAWLAEDFSFTLNTAGLLMGQVARYQVGNLVSNHFTIACTLEKTFLQPIRPIGI